MTNPDPSPADELVAAYLDNEATPNERARVEADPELLALLQTHRQIAALVAEPPTPPDPAVRSSHIATALQASTTAPNITSLTTHKQRWTPQYTRILSAAAAIALILFTGTLLILNNDNGDDTATSAAASDDGASVDADGSSEVADTGDGGEESAAEPAPAPADEPAPAPEPEPAPAEPPPDADDATSQAADDGGDQLTFAGQLAEATLRYQLADLPTIGALAAAVTNDVAEFNLDEGDRAADLERGPTCALEVEGLAQAQSPAPTLVFIAAGSIAGTPVEYVVLEEIAETTMVVFETSTCSILDTVALG